MRGTKPKGAARPCAAAGALLAVALGARASDDAGLAPELVKPLEKAAKELAKAGRASELDEVLALLREAGMADAAHSKLAATLRADATKARKQVATLPTTAKALQKCAADVVARTRGAEDATRAALALFALRLDGENAAAHSVFGRTKDDGGWLDDTARERRARARDVVAAIAAARRLDIAVETGSSRHELLAAHQGAAPAFARHGSITIHGVWPEAKLARALREAVRVLAVDQFLLTGEVALPLVQPFTAVLLDCERDYLAVVARARELGKIDDDDAARADRVSAVFAGMTLIGYDVAESSLSSTLHSYFAIDAKFAGAAGFVLDDAQPGAVAGLLNWSSLAVLGCRMPLFAWEETKEEIERRAGTAGTSVEERRVRERMLLLAEAGLVGGRAWMQYLAARREDPPFENALVDQIGRVQGQDLLKATFVLEMWLQDGPLLPVLRRLTHGAPGSSRAAVVEAGLRRPLAQLESEWRDWIVPARPGLAQRLATPPGTDALPPELQAAVDDVNALRRRSDRGAIEVDGDLESSRKCRKHAVYLRQNRDQLAAWPDAHEEYSDRPGFDPEGAFAGMHSVIAPGVAGAADAIESWMGTFYHRLPLLDPGLVRIGFAIERDIALLDCGTFVRGLDARDAGPEYRSQGNPGYWGVAWPPDGARDVPTRFVPELPEPIPGQDASRFGYPITYQMRYRFPDRPELDLELRNGSATGAVVDCHLSTPAAPTNPKLAPDHAWCLIPKAPLQPGATYFVRARLRMPRGVDDPFQWSFNTGR